MEVISPCSLLGALESHGSSHKHTQQSTHTLSVSLLHQRSSVLHITPQQPLNIKASSSKVSKFTSQGVPCRLGVALTAQRCSC